MFWYLRTGLFWRMYGIITRLAMEDLTSDLSMQPTQSKGQKAQSLEDIILKLGPIISISYEPF